MKIHTNVAKFKASPKKLFSFLSKEENLPKWATLFCKEIRKGDDGYIVTTSGGELVFAINADEKTGVIDMAMGPTKDQMWKIPTRVSSDNMGGSIFVFTYLQAPGQTEIEFENGCKGLEEEFEVIRKLVD